MTEWSIQGSSFSSEATSKWQRHRKIIIQYVQNDSHVGEDLHRLLKWAWGQTAPRPLRLQWKWVALVSPLYKAGIWRDARSVLGWEGCHKIMAAKSNLFSSTLQFAAPRAFLVPQFWNWGVGWLFQRKLGEDSFKVPIDTWAQGIKNWEFLNAIDESQQKHACNFFCLYFLFYSLGCVKHATPCFFLMSVLF